jgi:hypothetical protein
VRYFRSAPRPPHTPALFRSERLRTVSGFTYRWARLFENADHSFPKARSSADDPSESISDCRRIGGRQPHEERRPRITGSCPDEAPRQGRCLTLTAGLKVSYAQNPKQKPLMRHKWRGQRLRISEPPEPMSSGSQVILDRPGRGSKLTNIGQPGNTSWKNKILGCEGRI